MNPFELDTEAALFDQPELLQAMWENTLIYLPETINDRGMAITPEWDNVTTVAQLDRSIKRILRSGEPGFHFTTTAQGRRRPKATRIGEDYRWLSTLPHVEAVARFYAKRALHPDTMLLLREVEDQPWQGLPPAMPLAYEYLAADAFNTTLERIRRIARSEQHRKQVKEWESTSNDNHRGAVGYIDYLFDEVCGNIMALRMEFGYRRESACRRDIFSIQRDLKRFMNSWWNNSLYDNRIGYLWKIEYGDEKGFHLHFALLFNGHEERNETALGEAIGRHWLKLTKGEGTFCNANAEFRRKMKLRPQLADRLGVGSIHFSDRKKVENLKQYVVGYLTKPDKYVRLEVPEEFGAIRIFGRGEIPTERQPKRGKPRKGLGKETGKDAVGPVTEELVAPMEARESSPTTSKQEIPSSSTFHEQ